MCQDLNELIQEILEVRKIEETDIQLRVSRNVFISGILDKLLASFSILARQNNVELITSVPDNLYWNTDDKSFRKVISNLISNSLKYTPVGGFVKLTVTVEDDILRIVVRNSGKGIEKDKLNSIFNRHFILESTDVNANNQMTARNGLGLYICYSIVKMLQGEITVDSVVDEYTEFTITLPNQAQAENEIPDELSKTEPVITTVVEDEVEEEPKIDINSVDEASIAHVLIVDDNKDIVELVGDLLSPYCHVLKAFNAKEALKLVKKQTPSLVITDIMMPEIDGFSFIQMLREDKYCKRTPIIALSAKTDSLDLVKGYETGADAYITKPFSSEVLFLLYAVFYLIKWR